MAGSLNRISALEHLLAEHRESGREGYEVEGVRGGGEEVAQRRGERTEVEGE